MSPIEEIHRRLAARNVYLFGNAARLPVRVKIEKPTSAQLSAAQDLADEFDLEFWTGEDDAVIEPFGSDECEFHQLS